MKTLRLLVGLAIFSAFGNGVVLLANEPPPPPPPPLEEGNMHVETDSIVVRIMRQDIGDKDAYRSDRKIFAGLSAGIASVEQSVLSLGSRKARTHDKYESENVYLTDLVRDELRKLALNVLRESRSNSDSESSLAGKDHVLFEISIDGNHHLFSREYPVVDPEENKLLSFLDSSFKELASTDNLRGKKNDVEFLEGDVAEPREVSVEELILNAPKYENLRVAVYGSLKVGSADGSLPAFLLPKGGAFSDENELPKSLTVDGWSPYSEEKNIKELNGCIVRVEGLFRLEEGLQMSLGSVTAIGKSK